METRLSREALLRQLLDAENILSDEKMMYSYLLGYRLFQSPEYLLKEIQARFGVKDFTGGNNTFMRRNRRLLSKSKMPPCTKCQKKHEGFSKSTNNMLEKDSLSPFAEMLRADVMMQGAGRPIPNLSVSESEKSLSPLSSSEISTETLAKSTDFSLDYGDIGGVVFDEDNRRNTAPPAAMQALSTPQKLGKSTGVMVTSFSANKSKSGFISTASMIALPENLPETNIDDVILGEGIVTPGDDTIRRRKKGRRRTTVMDLDLSSVLLAQPTMETLKSSELTASDRRSVASRDSGILSGVVENDIVIDFHNSNNHNNNKPKKSSSAGSSYHPSDQPSKNQQNSGFTIQTPPTLTETLDKLAKDVEAQMCEHSCDENAIPSDTHARQLHLLHFLLVWVRDFPSDFTSNEALGSLKGLISSLEKDNKELKEHCAKVMETLTASMEAQNSHRSYTVSPEALPGRDDFHETKEAMIAIVTGMNDVGDAYKMAEQLCLIEMDLISHLGAEEFLQMFHSKEEKSQNSNLGACVRWFNHLSNLVATSVCLCRKPKHRRNVISLFTKSAARCYQLSNFNSAMAILTGLSLGAVARLKRTWSKIDTEEIEQLQSVFDPSNNFQRYRAMFRSRWAAMRNHQETDLVIPENHRHSTASQHSVTSRLSVASVTSQHRDSGIECENDQTASSKTPNTSSSTSSPTKKFVFDDVTSMTGIEDGVLVPFLTLMVKDVYFLNHSTPTIEANGTINFEKLRHLGEILHPLETWKNSPCVYKKNDRIQDFLLRSPVIKDTELYSLSYKREPPKNKFEKNQLKTIRAELESSKRGGVVRRMIARRKTM